MHNTFNNEIKVFLFCVLIGVIAGVIFDFFRALRYKRPVGLLAVIIQDIIYYLLVTLISFGIILNVNNAELRIYMPFAALIGFAIYRSTISNALLLIIVKTSAIVFLISKTVIKMIFLPLFKFIKWLLAPLIALKHKVLRKKCKIALTINKFCFKIRCKVLKLFSGIKICKERKPCLKKQRSEKRI